MRRSITILVLAALAALASSQTPSTVYAEAKREPHLDVFGFAHPGTGTRHFDLSMNNWFTVSGDAATSDASSSAIPWGMTWSGLCDNHWVFAKSFDVTTGSGDSIQETLDYYTIDKNYGVRTDDPDDDDPSNGDDIIVEGTITWVRTCTSQVTNDIYVVVVHRA